MNRPLPTIEGLTYDELTQIDDPRAKILRHRLLRRSFEAWCRYQMEKVGRQPAAHHLLIIDTIQAMLSKQLDKRRLMMLMPPGSAKSTYTSMLLPAFFVNPEQCPDDLMLACSYSYSLVEGFGKQARDTVENEGNVLGITPSKSSWAAGDWRVTREGKDRGGYFCAGVGAGIAGHRARLGLIDDYMGTEEEANSEVIREKIWKWYWNDFLPRLVPDSWQFIIANRRHEEDLVGRLLNDCEKDWHVIRLPMLAEEDDPLGRQVGDRLWPEWFTAKQVEDARKIATTWAGLYQQRPAPEEGNFFKKDWLVPYKQSELPADLRIYAGADYAVRKNEDADRHCFLLGGVDTQGVLWILPQWYWERNDTDVAVERMLDLVAAKQPITWFAGRENITGSIAPFLNARMRERRTFVTIEELSEAKDKQQKAQSIKARMSARMVRFPTFLPDWERAAHELLSFPNGKNDDFVDALSKLGQGLGVMMPPTKAKPLVVGTLEAPALTLKWLERSSKGRERRYVMNDN